MIQEQLPYISRAFTVENAYRCISLEHPEKIEVFDESDLALST